jgi:uncharacterized protein YjbJ (UPF0337 family)
MVDDIKKGKLHQVKDKVKEEAGKSTGNKTQEAKGKAENAAGKIQEKYRKGTGKVRQD